MLQKLSGESENQELDSTKLNIKRWKISDRVENIETYIYLWQRYSIIAKCKTRRSKHEPRPAGQNSRIQGHSPNLQIIIRRNGLSVVKLYNNNTLHFM